MTFLPIAERELRVASRRRGNYWMRSFIALAATVVGTCLYLFPELPPQRVAQYIFVGLAGLALGYSLSAGRWFTADCLSSEKREGTLGLLFLTHLKGYDVVAGKLAATSLRGFYGLLAVLPVLAIPLLMGGVARGEFWRVALVLVNTFFFCSSVGIFVSALSRDSRRAFGSNFSLLLLLIGGLPACIGVMAFSTSRVVSLRWLYTCPVYSFWLSFDANYQAAGILDFWWSIGIVHVMGWLLVLLTSWFVPYCWQDRPSGTVKLRWRDRWHDWSYGHGAVRKAFRKRLLDINAFYWLASRARLKPALVWSFLVFMVGWWLYVSIESGSYLMYEALLTTALILNSTLKLWVSVEAAQRLAEDQNIGALELLLSTRLTVRDILRGQLWALRRQFLWPLVSVIAIELLLTGAVLQHRGEDRQILLTWIAGILMLVADCSTLVFVAMSAALSSKNPNHAIVKTITRVLILPWLLFGVITVLAGLWSSVAPVPRPGWQFYLGLWFWLGLLTDAAFGLTAWLKVQTGFRELASRSSSRAKG